MRMEKSMENSTVQLIHLVVQI
uniref:Uncharacterized protein n=1 Tax=Arundo donax TaxID=35708 RepID=A0A0A9ARL5_ARUDO